tara:strand:- start:1313 stop:1489 length:177 start_codon:yes stop_codon:yes gene_type:complete
MFNKNLLIHHIQNTNNHSKMVDAGMKTGFGVDNNLNNIKESDLPQQPKYETIKEADYV